jgi:hypothetical protein
MLAIFVLAKIGTGITNGMRRRRFKKAVYMHLKTLTIPEKAILQVYFRHRTRTFEWPIDNSVVSALISRGLLYRDGMGDMRAFPTHVTEDVWVQINEHPELIA